MDQLQANFDLAINGRFFSQQMTGVQRVSREFVRALDRRLAAGAYPGLTARLIVPDDAVLAGEHFAAIRIEQAGGGSGHRWEQTVLPRHAGISPLLCLGNSAPVWSLLRRAPVAVMLHDLAYRLYPGDYSLAYRLFHRAVDAVLLDRARPLVTVSAAESAVIGRLHPRAAGRILVAPNGSAADDVFPPPCWAPKRGADAYGLYVGSLSDRKNGAGILRAAIDLARTTGIGFRLAGPAGSASSAAARGIPPDVRHLIHFCGYVDDAALRDLYAGASFFLFPSLYEASGLPPTEAMTIGCPVVVSDIAVLRERCGDAAVYCDPHDPAAILAAARSLIEQPELARRLSALGHAQAARFTWGDQVDRVIRALAGQVSGAA